MAMKKIGTQKDERIFSMATPQLASSSYRRVYDPESGVAPSSERILQDIEGAFLSMKIVAERKGVFVPGLAERSGRRFMKSEQKMGHGGKREAVDPSIAYLKSITKMHPSLQELMSEARVDGEDADGECGSDHDDGTELEGDVAMGAGGGGSANLDLPEADNVRAVGEDVIDKNDCEDGAEANLC